MATCEPKRTSAWPKLIPCSQMNFITRHYCSLLLLALDCPITQSAIRICTMWNGQYCPWCNIQPLYNSLDISNSTSPFSAYICFLFNWSKSIQSMRKDHYSNIKSIYTIKCDKIVKHKQSGTGFWLIIPIIIWHQTFCEENYNLDPQELIPTYYRAVQDNNWYNYLSFIPSKSAETIW